ncbi:hypothetical protein VAA049_1323 [Vibrio cholerae]|nr:hypothetical protein VAA049_1323 [Vibrio cholerae]
MFLVRIRYIEKVKTTKHKPSLTAWFFYFYIPKTSQGLAEQFVGESTKLVRSMFI